VQQACTRCGQEKPLDQFRFNARTGRHSTACTNCWKPHRQTRYIHKTIENYLSQKLRQSKRGGKGRDKRNISFNITLEDVMALYEKQGGRCVITGVALTHSEESPYTNASIDRIDPDLGYENENIRLVCSLVNIMRMRLSDEELGEWSVMIAKGMGLWK
jgi:hypothetical protein